MTREELIWKIAAGIAKKEGKNFALAHAGSGLCLIDDREYVLSLIKQVAEAVDAGGKVTP